MKPKVNTNPGANRYTTKNERIIEFYVGKGATGGLISIMEHDDGTVSIQLYRLDPMVVTVSFDGDGKANHIESGKGVIITPPTKAAYTYRQTGGEDPESLIEEE